MENKTEKPADKKIVRKKINKKSRLAIMREVADSLGMTVVRGSVSGKYYME